MSDGVLDSYLDEWREANPQRAAAWLFLTHDERARYGALAALQGEWLKAATMSSEPQVAAAKLGWWREEIARAGGGCANHPLLRGLFADARVRGVPVAAWTAPIDMLLLELAAPPPADFAAQLAAAQPAARALAELDCRIWFGQAGNESARMAVALARLVSALRSVRDGIGSRPPPLPMQLLARHGLTIDGLATDGPARRAALRDQARDLERELSRAATMPGCLTLFHAVRLQHDLRVLARARCSDDPLAALWSPDGGFRNLLQTWQAARAWRATPVTGNA